MKPEEFGTNPDPAWLEQTTRKTFHNLLTCLVNPMAVLVLLKSYQISTLARGTK
jgi:hypothetical protein